MIAMGGNSISPKNKLGTIEEQFKNIRKTLDAISHFIIRGYNLCINHGNGPQVGDELLRMDLTYRDIPPLPLGVCVAGTQGTIGYMIQQSLQNKLRDLNIDREVVTLITQVIVDMNDPEIQKPKKFIRIKEKVRVPYNDAWAQVSPFEGFKVAFTGVWDHPVHKKHGTKASINFNSTSFVKEVSRARTFGFMSDLEALKENDLALGASQKNAVAIGDDEILNEDGLRLENEMTKHKVLDAIGDLYLLGHNLVGSFEGYKSGHTVNNALLRELLARPETWEVTTYDDPDNSPITYLDPIIDPSSG